MHDLAKTHDQISLIRINNEKELRRYNVDALAQEIHGHSHGAERRFPLFLVYYHGAVCGYFQLSERIVVKPGFDPKLVNARDLVKIVRDLVLELKRQYGDPIYLLCGLAEQIGAENMRIFHVKKVEETIYMYDDEAEDRKEGC